MADTSFADAFIRGREMRKQHERQKKLDEEARQQRELGNQITGRNLALQDLELAKSMPAPVEQLPAGQQGPPQTLEQLITIPGVKALGVPERQVKPQTLTDVRIQQRADEDVKQSSAIERLRAELGIRKEAEAIPITEQIASLFGGALTPGESISPAQANLASAGFQGQENRKSREAIAAESAATRRDAAAQRAHEKQLALDSKKAEKEDDAGFYATRVHAGDIALDEVPQKLRPAAGLLAEVLARREPGKVFASKKDREHHTAFEQAKAQAEGLLANFTPGAVGPIDSRLPTFKGKTAYYESQIAGMFNEIGKLRSGGAITPQEYTRLANEIPQATDLEAVFKAKAQRFIDEMNNKQATLVTGGSKPTQGGSAAGGAQPKRLTFNPATGELE